MIEGIIQRNSRHLQQSSNCSAESEGREEIDPDAAKLNETTLWSDLRLVQQHFAKTTGFLKILIGPYEQLDRYRRVAKTLRPKRLQSSSDGICKCLLRTGVHHYQPGSVRRSIMNQNALPPRRADQLDRKYERGLRSRSRGYGLTARLERAPRVIRQLELGIALFARGHRRRGKALHRLLELLTLEVEVLSADTKRRLLS